METKIKDRRPPRQGNPRPFPGEKHSAKTRLEETGTASGFSIRVRFEGSKAALRVMRHVVVFTAKHARTHLRIIPVQRRGSYRSLDRPRIGLVSGGVVQHPEVPPVYRQTLDIFQALQGWPEPGIQRQSLKGEKEQLSLVVIYIRRKAVINPYRTKTGKTGAS